VTEAEAEADALRLSRRDLPPLPVSVEATELWVSKKRIRYHPPGPPMSSSPRTIRTTTIVRDFERRGVGSGWAASICPCTGMNCAAGAGMACGTPWDMT